MPAITLQALGRKKPLLSDWSVSLPPAVSSAGGRATLRDLIEHVVHLEVAAFKDRQAERRLTRALTERDINAGADRGKIVAGGDDLNQKVDTEEAVAAALQAFEDGLYLVAIDGERQTNLDTELALADDSQVTFIRLTMLAG